jgi:hypothetical protein
MNFSAREYFIRKALFLMFVLSAVKCFSQDAEEYMPVEMQTGQTPSCYEFRQSSDAGLDNFLKVNVGGGADVVLKLVRSNDDVCIRYVYVKSDETYSLRNIPAGIYYLKIAYGNDWAVSKTGGGCSAKFLSNNLYQVGTDLLDFNPVRYSEGIQIQSFELILKTIAGTPGNEFQAENITEDEFNK